MNKIVNPLSFNQKVPKIENEQRKQRNYQNLKPAYDLMNWKNYTIQRPRNLSVQEVDRQSAKHSVRQHNSPSYYEPGFHDQNGASHLNQKKLRQQNLRLSGVTYNKRQEHVHRVKEDAIRRVKMLQQKVLPLINNDKGDFQQKNQQYGFSWQLKMQQKLAKIQNSIQNVKNQAQIKFQKRLVQIQRYWQQRINELLASVQGINNNNQQNELQQYYKKQQPNQNINYQQNYSMNKGTSQQQHVDSMNNRQEYHSGNNNKYNYYRSGFENDVATKR